ncbi:MAG: hypothetical protein M1836_006850 [Candelina mexicana]|nr:MAG: hypothetical protein M1836_006850 [Candelina mexicana]
MSTGTRLSLSGPPREFVPEREGITLFALNNPQCRKWFGLRYVSQWEDLKSLACATFGVTGEMVIYYGDHLIYPSIWQEVVRAGAVYGVAFYPYIAAAVVLRSRSTNAGVQAAVNLQAVGTTIQNATQPSPYNHNFQVRTSTNADVADLRREIWYSMPSDPTSGPESLRLASVSPWRLHGRPSEGTEYVMENGNPVGAYLWGPVYQIIVEVTEP